MFKMTSLTQKFPLAVFKKSLHAPFRDITILTLCQMHGSTVLEHFCY